MINQNVIVGRIINSPILVENDNLKYTTLSISVPRRYKNNNDEQEFDCINTILIGGIAENTLKYCEKGSLIGIKGRLETRKVNPNEEINYVTEIVAEKVTILSNDKGEDDENFTNSL